MKAIFKYNFKILLPMPLGAKILTLQLQNNEPVIWAEVETKEERTEDRVFHYCNTGDYIVPQEESRVYLASLQFANGVVQHFFEVKVGEQ